MESIEPNPSDYLSFVTGFPDVPIISVLTLFFLALMRIAPIAAMVPFLGKSPSGIRAGFMILIAIIIFPYLISHVHRPAPTFDFLFGFYCLKELLIGFILMFLVSIPFYIAQSCGVFIDFLRGSSALQVTDPFMQTPSSTIGQFYHYIFILIFYQIGGPFIFLKALLNSYSFIPVDRMIPPIFFHLNQPFWHFLTTLLTKFLSLSIQLAAPSILAILMAEMFLGIVNRLVPQIQIAFLGISLKSLSGLALLWAGWYFILQNLTKEGMLWVKFLERLIQTFPNSY